uniref:receptor-like protein 6 n=1 Tax=Erigeron canadensis TaxID=72917 RepID=UPI001CB91B8A|nr:receptor-like protein 6 [Erigeron canadensis]
MDWNTSADCCEWDRVTCDHSTGDVIGLDLRCGMLQGTIHSNTSLFNLPRLQRLALGYNDFSGSQLPREIGKLSNTLTLLDMSYGGFYGQVPMDITLLHKLVYLDLSWNTFNFEPHAFINLLQNSTTLEELSLSSVNISSFLPTNLNISSSSLKILNLHQTGLQGNLPVNIFKLQSLEILDLSLNSLAGQVPWEVSLLPKLVSLDLCGRLYCNLSIKPHSFNGLLQNSTLLRHLGVTGVNIGILPTYLTISSSSLKTLNLRGTGLHGKLPLNIFNLQYLEGLEMSGNPNLTGSLSIVTPSTTIPPLTFLGLSSTNLSGEIPDSIGRLKSLRYLVLSHCGFSGSIPQSIGSLSYLIYLDLSNNKLNGMLPSSLFSLRSLEQLSLAYNQFADHIDVHDKVPNLHTFCQLTNLTALDLSHNNLSGRWELDALLSSLTSLKNLILSYSGVSVMTNDANYHVNPNLEVLSLASCKIKVFPDSLRSMRNLQYLDLSRNEIHGHIPHWAGVMGGSQLKVLSLSNNFITGLPLFQWYGLQELQLSSNLIQGPFPRSICNLSNLMFIDVSNNSFDGVIPQCIGNITHSLRVMNLGNNFFQGTIPNAFMDCGRLQGLIMNGNELEGGLPSSLSKCQSLEVIDLGNNQLNGTFPYWLGSLPKLQVVVLKSNNFHGIIETPSTIKVPFQSLRVLDISQNWFVGQLPQKYFQNFNAMKVLGMKRTKQEYLYYSITFTVKGVEQRFQKILVEYTIIDLSDNRFEGEIPSIIGSLNSMIVLNLSRNSLTGQIPHALGDLSEIESLDLSCNQLTGEIPQSLVDLTFLEYLNLSQNHLMGRIPVGNQFNTFGSSSFSGNPKLCGLPLPKRCHENVEGDADDDEEENWFTWRVVTLGYGCGTLIGLVMGYFMLSTGRPMWFNAIFDAWEHMILKNRNKKRCIYIGR